MKYAYLIKFNPGFIKKYLLIWPIIIILSFIAHSAFAANLCTKNVTGSITLDGVVAPGVSATCVSDPVWTGIGPAQFSPAVSPIGYLYLAYYDPTPNNTANNDSRLLIGIDTSGDQDVSDLDMLLLFFDADNNNTWNNSDFAVRIKISPSASAITSGEMCNQNTGNVTYYQRDGTSWTEKPAVLSQIYSRHAYDYDTISDPEDHIWNLEIDMPVRYTSGGSTYLDLNTSSPYFGMGGYIFADYGHQQTPQQGTVLTWPAGLISSITGSIPDISFNTPQLSEPSPVQLGDINLEDVCFDVRFAGVSDPWMINGSTAASGDNLVNRSGLNTFRVKYYFDGPGSITSPISNPGNVELGLKPYGVGGGSRWIKSNTINNTPYNYNQSRVVDFQFDFSNPPANFGNPQDLDFVCATTTLDSFKLDDDNGNNKLTVNFNYFTTSEYEQSFLVTADNIPGLKSGDKTTVFLHMDMTNEHPNPKTSAIGVLNKNSPIKNDGSISEGIMPLYSMSDLISTKALIQLAIILLLISFSIYFLLKHNTKRFSASFIVGISLILLIFSSVFVACRYIHRLNKTGRSIGNEYWQVTNAGTLGIRPVEGREDWYQVPMIYGETKRIRVRFAGQPLPYKTERTRLVPSIHGKPQKVNIPVKQGLVITLIAFGEVDVDGEGPLAPTSATGFTEPVQPAPSVLFRNPMRAMSSESITDLDEEAMTGQSQRYPLTEGYYRANEYAGALIGSFNGFRTSFVIGRDASIIIPDGASTLSLSVNARWESYAVMNGAFEIIYVFTPAPDVPTRTTLSGDATYEVPLFVPIWHALTSLNVYSYYSTERVEEGVILGQTMHPWSEAHFSIYESHI